MPCGACQLARLNRAPVSDEWKTVDLPQANMETSDANDGEAHGLSDGAIAAIVLSSIALFLILVYAALRIYWNKSDRHEHFLKTSPPAATYGTRFRAT